MKEQLKLKFVVQNDSDVDKGQGKASLLRQHV